MPHAAAEPGLFEALPPVLRGALDGGQLQALPGFTLSLLSVDEAGRVRTSLLGLAEVYAPPRAPARPDRLRLALWPAARTVRNLERTRRGALTCVLDATLFQIQLDHARRLPDAGGLALFEANVEHVEAQRVAYAELQSGITFALSADADQTGARWAAQLAALRGA